MLLEPVQPMFQCLGVMQSQVFDIEHRQPPGFEDFHHLVQTGRIRAREYAPLDPRIHRARSNTANTVDQTPPLWFEATIDDLSQRRVMLLADMFQHANRDKDVELADDAAVIIEDVFHSVGQTLLSGGFPRIVDLLSRDVIRPDSDTVVFCHETC